jgi:hypothetical protein
MPHSRPKLQRLVTSVLGRQAQATRVSLASPPAISSLQRGKVIEANQPRNASRNFKREHVVIWHATKITEPEKSILGESQHIYRLTQIKALEHGRNTQVQWTARLGTANRWWTLRMDGCYFTGNNCYSWARRRMIL